MTIVERLTPDSDIRATLESLSMPITAALVFQVLFIILNLFDGEDDTLVGLPNQTGFVLMAVLLAFWIGIVAVNEGGNIGDALVGAAILGLVYGIMTALFQEVLFSESTDFLGNTNEDFFTDGYFKKAMILSILNWMVLFVMLAFVGAGLTEDIMGEVDTKSAKKAPAKKAPAKKKTTKKTTKKATKVAD